MLMSRSFTVKSKGGLLTTLGTPCHVSQAFDPANGVPEFTRLQVDAMFDTGAAKSVITQRVVEACGLKPVRSGFIQGVHGVQKSEAYVVNIYLPSKITFFELTVVKAKATGVWWDVLLGMDVISAGDFSITNVCSNTEFTFRVPSQSHIERSETTSTGALNWLRGLVGKGSI
jgi:gag-polyprotein putative aspartyl protease